MRKAAECIFTGICGFLLFFLISAFIWHDRMENIYFEYILSGILSDYKIEEENYRKEFHYAGYAINAKINPKEKLPEIFVVPSHIMELVAGNNLAGLFIPPNKFLALFFTAFKNPRVYINEFSARDKKELEKTIRHEFVHYLFYLHPKSEEELEEILAQKIEN